MRKLFIGILAIAVVFGMSMGVMADELPDLGDNDATIDQTGSFNTANINQTSDYGSEEHTKDEAGIHESRIFSAGELGMLLLYQ